MIFNSVAYLIFFLIILMLMWIVPGNRMRVAILLTASYYFYGSWSPIYIFLLAGITLVAYYSSYLQTKSKNKRTLFASIAVSFSPLVLYKYGDFSIENVNTLAERLGWNYSIDLLKLLLPVGISFFTFQAVSYIVDVYKGTIKHEKSIANFSLYLSLFPQLVAGPIVRPQTLIPQIKNLPRPSKAMFKSGAHQFLWGYYKKIVIADSAAIIVNNVYNNTGDYGGFAYMLATVFFAFQILCDFSGYSDMAIGSARMLGFNFEKNFNRPYFAVSVSDFWRRWHMSLSSWLRDYVYIPLGGSRVGKRRLLINIMITFLISGLWHGAAWTFVVWGGINGLMIVVANLTNPIKSRFVELSKGLFGERITMLTQVLITFILVCITWIFFRANSMDDALHIIASLSFEDLRLFTGIEEASQQLGVDASVILSSIVGITTLLAVNLYQNKKDYYHSYLQLPTGIRWFAQYVLILQIVFLGSFGGDEFIYFQF